MLPDTHMEVDAVIITPNVASVTTQTDAVTITQPRAFEDAATVTDDIIAYQHVDHDHSYTRSSVTEASASIATCEVASAAPTESDDSCNSGKTNTESSDDYTYDEEPTESESNSSSADDIDEKKRHFIVSEKCFLALFCICHILHCYKPIIIKPIIKVCGFAVAIMTECIDGHKFMWHSQPKINNTYSCNLLIPSAIFLTGHSYTLYKEMCDIIHLCTLSARECYNIQRAFIIPEIELIWTCHSEAIMSAAQGVEIIASGDARCDSPGHNATFGTYSIMDTRSKLLIAQETVRVTEVKNSYWMEVEGLKRCLNKLFDHGVAIATLATDRHPSVRKTMEDDYNTIRHEYDLWHIAKSVKKRLLAAKKADLTPWVNAIANHLWYCSSACKGNAMLMKEMWTSVLHHIQNKHTWTGGAELYKSCNHTAYSDTETRTTPWLEEDSDAFRTLQKLVLDRKLLRDLERVTQCVHTGDLESVHALFLKYAPKRKKFTEAGITARLHLASMDHNANVQVN